MPTHSHRWSLSRRRQCGQIVALFRRLVIPTGVVLDFAQLSEYDWGKIFRYMSYDAPCSSGSASNGCNRLDRCSYYCPPECHHGPHKAKPAKVPVIWYGQLLIVSSRGKPFAAFAPKRHASEIIPSSIGVAIKICRLYCSGQILTGK